MRDYAKLGPTFWTGSTGKALRKRGANAMLCAVYLVSAPASNMLGLYYLALPTMAHETGLGIEGAWEGLRSCIDVGFCSYDDDTEMVYVHEMAAWQIADQLDAKDKRCAGVQREFDSVPTNPFLGAFYARYKGAFHLTRCRGSEPPSDRPPAPPPPPKPAPTASPSEAPSEPLRSQEQEQEQEQEQIPRTDTQPGVSVDNFPAPTPYGAAFGLLHRLGVVGADPADPVFKAVVDKGVTDDEWRTAAAKAAGRGRTDVRYVVGVVEKQRKDAAAIAEGMGDKAAQVGTVVPPAESTAQYQARMAAERAAEQVTPEQRAAAEAARDAVLARHGRRRKPLETSA